MIDDDMAYIEPEKLNLAVLRAATNNFSEENKLGEGGFGQVFKVHFHLSLSLCLYLDRNSIIVKYSD